ncbi:MAG: acetylornithine deacetylase [Betaproteobacteria bacterium]|jgi:acetylornithine deacetylase|nr:acetylornithine deacetylase [Betaproteobacteria bacterium]
MSDVVTLARELVSIDSRSFVSTRLICERLTDALKGWEIEPIDYVDSDGTEKRNLVARRGTGSGAAFAGHMDTVPDAGWKRDPFAPDVEDGILYGLGTSDMKGAVAASIVALSALPQHEPAMMLLTADEESTKRGVREMIARSELLRASMPKAIIIGEPTCLQPIRGHRADVQFVAHARGVQAHSSLAEGRNANIALIPFLADMRELYLKLRSDASFQDAAYDPTWCDLNIIVDNYGTAPNTTVGQATCRMKLRYSKSIDPAPIVDAVKRAAERHSLELEIRPEASPPELRRDHPLVCLVERIAGRAAGVAALGTEASEYKKVAPPLIIGPGYIDHSHKPSEHIRVADLGRAVELFSTLALEINGADLKETSE